MSGLTHAEFQIERTYQASAAQVFAAWSSSDAISKWAPPMEGMVFEYTRFEFEPGGKFTYKCGPGGAMVIEGSYLDILKNERIIFTEVGDMGGAHSKGGISAMMNSIELTEEGGKTRLVMTVQISSTDAENAKNGASFGWGKALENLKSFL